MLMNNLTGLKGLNKPRAFQLKKGKHMRITNEQLHH